MALGTVGGALVGSAASGLLTTGLGALSGGFRRPPSIDVQPIQISTPGVQSFLRGNQIVLQPSQQRSIQFNRAAQTRFRQADTLENLRPQIRPGFGRLTEARRGIFESARERLEDRRRRTIGNLRDSLARRRVLGSRFATDDIIRAGLAFEQEERALDAQQAEAEARSFLQEFELLTQNINQSFEAEVAGFQTLIDEFNLDTQLAANLANAATETLSKNARTQAALAAEAAQGRGEFFGQAFEPFITGAGGAIGGLLT